jgi:hypothetical protein
MLLRIESVSRIEMKRQLTAVKMGEKDNPATMFEKFHHFRMHTVHRKRFFVPAVYTYENGIY